MVGISVAAPVVAGLAVGIAFIAAFAMTWNGSDGKREEITLTVDVGEPRQGSMETGLASSLTTKYLLVNMTQTINLAGPTAELTLYPIFADWDGIIRGAIHNSIVDGNNNRVPYSGSGRDVLHGVNATCTEPYFVQIKDIAGSEDGSIEKTNAPVSSIIYWGDTFDVHFDRPATGTIYYTQSGYGIVPADYNDNIARNNGAGNQELLGAYHLSFVSFYPATINLPEQAATNSSLEIVCTINDDSTHVQKSEFPRIFVYDVRFELPAGSD